MSDKTLYLVYAVSDRNRFRRALLVEARTEKESIEVSLESTLLANDIGQCGDTVEAMEVVTSRPHIIYLCRGELRIENELWSFPDYTALHWTRCTFRDGKRVWSGHPQYSPREDQA